MSRTASGSSGLLVLLTRTGSGFPASRSGRQ